MLAVGWANAKWTEWNVAKVKRNKNIIYFSFECEYTHTNTHRKCSKRCQENVTLPKTKHDAKWIVDRVCITG